MKRALLVVWLATVAAPARADAVDPWDPELAQLCGGSAHAPHCSAASAGLACGCTVVGLTALAGIALAARDRRPRA